MPRLIITDGAVRGLDRCRRFLAERNPRAAINAAVTISTHLRLLEENPDIGRPQADGLRELVIGFGATGYVALYRFDAATDIVFVLALRHQKEAGY